MATVQEALEGLGDPEILHIINISGGKDSAALAVHVKEQYPRIHEAAIYLFCDTGTELPETYEYLRRLEAFLGKPVQRLTALATHGIREKPGRTAFEVFLNEQFSGFLPNPQARWCTRVLKIEPFEAFVGGRRAFTYLGVRADENREGYVARKPPVLSHRPNIVAVYPFKDDGLRLRDIKKLLEQSGLGIPEYYQWRSRSGCYFCFYQQAAEWQGLADRHPDLFQKAQGFERKEGLQRFTWVAGRTLEQVVANRRIGGIPRPRRRRGMHHLPPLEEWLLRSRRATRRQLRSSEPKCQPGCDFFVTTVPCPAMTICMTRRFSGRLVGSGFSPSSSSIRRRKRSSTASIRRPPIRCRSSSPAPPVMARRTFAGRCGRLSRVTRSVGVRQSLSDASSFTIRRIGTTWPDVDDTSLYRSVKIHFIRDLSGWAPQQGAEWEPEKEAAAAKVLPVDLRSRGGGDLPHRRE